MESMDKGSPPPEELAEIAEELARFSHCLKSPRSRGPIADKWLDFKVWWEMKVWDRYAPMWLVHLKWDWNHFYYNQISSRIWPRQRWLTRQIPRTWQDKTTLIPHVLYAMVIHFVDEDGEDCFNSTDYVNSGLADFETKLREVYAWAKTGRAEFQKRVDDALPSASIEWKELGNGLLEMVDTSGLTYEEKYGEHNRLEAEFRAKDTEYLVWIVSQRDQFWA